MLSVSHLSLFTPGLMMGPVVESPYGVDVEPSQAPEAISNAVASLPPEQMFELMRQMQVSLHYLVYMTAIQ